MDPQEGTPTSTPAGKPGEGKPGDTAQDGKKIDETLRNLFYFLVALVILITVVILIAVSLSATFAKALGVFATFLSICGAYLFSGAIIGFLFAIPRSGTYRYKAGQENPKSWYDDNTNLEEISDWLTKIIVGLTLVQFNKILQLTDTAARNITVAFSGSDTFSPQFYPWAYASIVFFVACGFVISYLWTRINFALILTVSRKRLNEIANIEDERAHLQTQVDNEKAELEKVKDEVTAVASQENVRKAVTTKLIGELEHYPDSQRELIRQRIDASKGKPIVVPDDLQKGRWGGKDINNGKKLYAVVTKSDKVAGYFNVSVHVRSVLPDVPVESPVAVFVHDSFGFPDNVILVDTNADGEAVVDLLAYEAFTIGALCMDGTQLELDLNQVTGFPTDFYWK